jgi:hypothetical protein
MNAPPSKEKKEQKRLTPLLLKEPGPMIEV